MITNNYVKTVYENLCRKYSHEKEFLQAVCEVLETLERQDDQDAAAFRRDLKTLEELWHEKYPAEELY